VSANNSQVLSGPRLPTCVLTVLAAAVVIVPAILALVAAELLVSAGAIFLPKARVGVLLKLLDGDELAAIWSFAPGGSLAAVMSHIICRYIAPSKDLKPHPLSKVSFRR
jgi:hypothetical protein